MKRSEVTNLNVYADGGCKGNGKTNAKAYGTFVVFAVKADGSRTEVKRCTEEYPHRSTNNQAEYEALIQALSYLKGLQEKGFAFPTTIMMDSELVCSQLNGTAKIKNAGLSELNKMAKEMIDQLKVDLHWRDRTEIEPVVGH